MDIQNNGQPKKIRLICGPPELVEHEINEALNEYVLSSINFAVVGDKLTVTAIMTHQAEVRKAMIAQAGQRPR